MIRLLKEMKTEDRRMALLCILLVGGQVYLDLKLPDYTKEITTLVSMENSILSAYFIAGGKMLACAFASANCRLFRGKDSRRLQLRYPGKGIR